MGFVVVSPEAALQSSLMQSRHGVDRIGSPSSMVAPSRSDVTDNSIVLRIVLEMDMGLRSIRPLTSKIRILASECSLAPSYARLYATKTRRSGDDHPVNRNQYVYTVRQLRQRIWHHLEASRETTSPLADLDLFVHASSIASDEDMFLAPDNDDLNVLSHFGSRLGIRAGWRHSDPLQQDRPVLAIQGRYYDFNGSLTVCNKALHILEVPNQHNAGTSFNVWDGSLLLSQYLEQNRQYVRDRRVLELGSGCGLAGLAAAAAGASHVTLTDLAGEPLRHLKANADRNTASLPGSILEVKACDWWDAADHSWLSMRQYHTVLVADCVWTEDRVEPLLSVLRTVTQLDAVTTTVEETLDTWHIEEPLVEVPAFSDIRSRKTTRDERSSSTLDESQHEHIRGTLLRSDSLGYQGFPSFDEDDDDESLTSFHEECQVEATQVIIAYQRRGNSTHQAFWKGLRRLFGSIQHVHVPDQPDVFSLLICRR